MCGSALYDISAVASRCSDQVQIKPCQDHGRYGRWQPVNNN